jgi:hypothetical protein
MKFYKFGLFFLKIIIFYTFNFFTMQNLNKENLNVLNAIDSLSQNKEIYEFIKKITEENISNINISDLDENIQKIKNLIITIGFTSDQETKSDTFKTLLYVYKFFLFMKKVIEFSILQKNYAVVMNKNKDLFEKKDKATKINETIQYLNKNNLKTEDLKKINISLINKKHNINQNINILKNESNKIKSSNYEGNNSFYSKLKNIVSLIEDFFINFNENFSIIKDRLNKALEF